MDLAPRSFQASLLAKTFQNTGKGTDMWFFSLGKAITTVTLEGNIFLKTSFYKNTFLTFAVVT